jgi:hypothetical protein
MRKPTSAQMFSKRETLGRRLSVSPSRDDHEGVVKVVLDVLHLHFVTGDPLKCGGEENENCGRCAQPERQEEILVQSFSPAETEQLPVIRMYREVAKSIGEVALDQQAHRS